MGQSPPKESIVLNGINGAAPGYLVEPFTFEDLRAVAKRLKKGAAFSSSDHLVDLQYRNDKGAAHYDISAKADPLKLKQAGWGVVFSAQAEPQQVAAIREALSELLDLRKGQASGFYKDGGRYQEYSGEGGYDAGESGDQFCARHGMQPGPVDPKVMPYYLLIVADPQSIPFSFQYELDVQFSVGRIYFDTLEEYACYAHSVARAETPGALSRTRRAAFFGPANQLDPATQLSAKNLVTPLYQSALEDAETLGWEPPVVYLPKDFDNPDPTLADAPSQANLLRLLGGDQTPALLFTATHGLGFPSSHSEQVSRQGALVCQEWTGPLVNAVPTKDMFVAAEHIDSQSADLSGTVAFFFACFSLGTPLLDDFALAKNKTRQALAERAFLSALPRKLLSLPKGGALAVIGHVERAWGYSFNWSGAEAKPEAFKSTLYKIMAGEPVGHAMDYLNDRYAQIATMLVKDFEDVKVIGNYDSTMLAYHWMANNDARSYAILGDPAVRIS